MIAVQFAKFLVVGGIATATQYGVLIALVRLAAAEPVLASSVGYVASALLNYELNYRFTFRSSVGYLGGLARFAAVASLGLVVNGLVMAVATRMIQLHFVLAQVLATTVVLLWNFYANRRWTF